MFINKPTHCFNVKTGVNHYTMKKIMFVSIMLLGFSIFRANAQFVGAKPAFSVGISVGAPGPTPYGGGVWIGPEWVWRGNRYVEVPG